LLQLQGQKVSWARDVVIQEGKFRSTLTDNSVKDSSKIQGETIHFPNEENDKYLNENESENSEKIGEKTAKNTPSEMSIDKESDVEMEEVINENNSWLPQFQKELQEAADEEIL
jgi:hypothetical protein